MKCIRRVNQNERAIGWPEILRIPDKITTSNHIKQNWWTYCTLLESGSTYVICYDGRKNSTIEVEGEQLNKTITVTRMSGESRSIYYRNAEGTVIQFRSKTVKKIEKMLLG